MRTQSVALSPSGFPEPEEAWEWFPEENDQLVARLQLQFSSPLKEAIATIETQACFKKRLLTDDSSMP